VVTVTALSRGVNRAQGEVLHSLYGQDTAITVTKAPSFGSGGPGGFRFRAGGSGSRPKAGSKVSVDSLTSTALSAIPATDVASVARLNGVAAAAGGLTLNDTKLTFTSQSSGGGSGGGNPGRQFGSGHFPTPISVHGVDLSGNAAALGPLSAAKLVSGCTLTASDANSDVALVSSNYATAHKLKTGSTVTLAKTSFKVVGVVSAGSSDSTDVYIPLARAQALGTAHGKSLKNKVNTVYVAAGSATGITTVSKEISANMPGATVTNQNDLAKQLTGSVSAPPAWHPTWAGGWPSRCWWRRSCWPVLMTTAAVSPGAGVRHAEGTGLDQPPHPAGSATAWPADGMTEDALTRVE
jgi:putative ABC transport system permease protein